MLRRQGRAALMVAVLWMEMRLGALRVPRRQWPASRGLPRRLGSLKAPGTFEVRRQGRAALVVAVLWLEIEMRLWFEMRRQGRAALVVAVLWLEMRLGALRMPRRQGPAERKRWQEAEMNSSRRQRPAHHWNSLLSHPCRSPCN